MNIVTINSSRDLNVLTNLILNFKRFKKIIPTDQLFIKQHFNKIINLMACCLQFPLEFVFSMNNINITKRNIEEFAIHAGIIQFVNSIKIYSHKDFQEWEYNRFNWIIKNKEEEVSLKEYYSVFSYIEKI